MKEIIAKYNRFRAENQNVQFSTSQLKTEFEKLGIPFNYHYLPAYIQFKIVIKQARNKYIMPNSVIYKDRLSNAWKFTTAKRRSEYKLAS